MRSRDVVGKRIVSIWNERQQPDDEYYGPKIACIQLELEDGTRIVAHCSETSDQPLAWMAAAKKGADDKMNLFDKVLEYEAGLIRDALREAGGSVTRAAQSLEISQQALVLMLNNRHKELLSERKPIIPRRRSIMGKVKKRKKPILRPASTE